MSQSTRRPAGLVVIATLVALNGLASLVEALEIATLPMGNTIEALISAVLGLALLHRAYGVWTLQRGAWLITLVLLSTRAVLAILRILLLPTPTAWVSLILVVVALVILVQPGTRALLEEGQSRT